MTYFVSVGLNQSHIKHETMHYHSVGGASRNLWYRTRTYRRNASGRVAVSAIESVTTVENNLHTLMEISR